MSLLPVHVAHARPVPFLLMTNGGGVVDSERVKLLSRDLGVEVGYGSAYK